MSISAPDLLYKVRQACINSSPNPIMTVFQNQSCVGVELILSASELGLRTDSRFTFTYSIQDVYYMHNGIPNITKCFIINYNKISKFAISIPDSAVPYVGMVVIDYDNRPVDLNTYVQGLLLRVTRDKEWRMYLTEYCQMLSSTKTDSEYEYHGDDKVLSIHFVLNRLFSYTNDYFNVIRSIYDKIKRKSAVRTAKEVDHFDGDFLKAIVDFSNGRNEGYNKADCADDSRMILLAHSYCDIVMRTAYPEGE